MTDRLFVYGTLAPGRPNAPVLADVAGQWEEATVRGSLVEHGWGAGLGYPAIVLDDAGPEVAGFLLTSEELDAHWDRLDEFEGEGYDRVVVTVRRLNGAEVPAQIYVHHDQAD